MSFTNLWEKQVLEYLFRGTALTNLPTATTGNFYIGLHIGGSAPSDDGTGFVEPTGGAYARVAVLRHTTDWTAGTDDGGGNFQLSNVNVINFPKATANWGTVTHIGLFAASGDTQPVDVAALGTAKPINLDDTGNFGAGTLIFKLG